MPVGSAAKSKPGELDRKRSRPRCVPGTSSRRRRSTARPASPTSGSSRWPRASATSTHTSTGAIGRCGTCRPTSRVPSLEKALWAENSLAAMGPIADQLDADVAQLHDLVATVTFQPAQLANGAAELLDEIAASKVTGEEERYSHLDRSFRYTSEGAREADRAPTGTRPSGRGALRCLTSGLRKPRPRSRRTGKEMGSWRTRRSRPMTLGHSPRRWTCSRIDSRRSRRRSGDRRGLTGRCPKSCAGGPSGPDGPRRRLRVSTAAAVWGAGALGSRIRRGAEPGTRVRDREPCGRSGSSRSTACTRPASRRRPRTGSRSARST